MARDGSWAKVVLIMILAGTMALPTAPLAEGKGVPPARTQVGTFVSNGGGLSGQHLNALVDRGAIIPGAIHDLQVTASNATALAGTSVNFLASFPGTGTAYEWWWGDNSTSTTLANQTSHTYATPGIYLIYATANTTSGTWHDNLGALLRFVVQNSFTNDVAGQRAILGGSVVANTTNRSGADAVALPGGFVQFSNWISEGPTNPNWIPATPSYEFLAPPGEANMSSPILSRTGLSAATLQVSPNATNGVFAVVFSVVTDDQSLSSNATSWSNYTFTLVIAAAGVPGYRLESSPHPGVLDVYQVYNDTPNFMSGSGAQLPFGLDPATTSNNYAMVTMDEVYQTLVAFNGSEVGPQPSDFVPDLATCVPGTASCTTMYGNDLIQAGNQGTVYTFVINSNATFYNASTGAHAPVWPNDVAFSIIRSCIWGNIGGAGGGVSANDESSLGSQVCIALLGWTALANESWDSGLHWPLNNTPSNLLRAVTVNNTAYCTPVMRDGIHGDGCVTLSTNASTSIGYGQWATLLDDLASPSESVYSCSWAAANHMGLPGWTNASSCLGTPPPPTLNSTAWDSYMRAVPWPLKGNDSSDPLNFHAVGSGPYALSSVGSFMPGTSMSVPTNYTLVANPYWLGTTCSGGLREGCLPDGPSNGTEPYYGRVEVHFVTNESTILDAPANESADLLDLPSDATFSTLQSVEDGQIGAFSVPTPVISEISMDLNYSPSLASTFLASNATLPPTALQDYAFRQFLAAAYPHATAQASSCILSGMEYCFQFGGAIPAFMGSYTPSNLSWPVSDPSGNASQIGSAAWLWSQVANDSLVGAYCHQASPCTFAIAAPADYPMVVSQLQEFASTIKALSDGALKASVIPISGIGNNYVCNTLWISLCVFHNTNCTTSQLVGEWCGPSPFAMMWEEQFPSQELATDYFGNLMGVIPALSGSWEGSPNDIPLGLADYSSPCGGSVSDPQVTQECQFTALMDAAKSLQNATYCERSFGCPTEQSALQFDDGDHVFANLSIYIPSDQVVAVDGFAPWIDPTTLDLNPELTATGVVGQHFYDIQTLSTIPQGYPLIGGDVTGSLPAHVQPDLTNKAPSQEVTHISGVVIPVNRTVPLLISAAGGTGVYHYSWYGLPPGCTSADRPALLCKPDTAGVYIVGSTIIDSKGSKTSAPSVTLIVTSTISIASFMATPSTLSVGQATDIEVSAIGGTPPDNTYAYTGLPLGCSSSDTSNFTCFPSSSGNFVVRVFVNDSAGHSVTATTPLTVIPSLKSVEISPSPDHIQVGGSADFTASPACSGGACPSKVTYVWSINNTLGSLNSSAGRSVNFTAGSVAGTVSLEVNATLNGVLESNVATIAIGAPPAPTLESVSIRPSSPSLTAGATQVFTANTSCNGGTCPSGTTYAWKLNNSLGTLSSMSGSSISFIAGSNVGSVTLTVGATLNGITKWGNATIIIQAKSSNSSGFLGFSGDTGYILIGVIVAVVVIAVALMLLRGRRQRPAPRTPSNEEPEGKDVEKSEAEKPPENTDTQSEPEKKS